MNHFTNSKTMCALPWIHLTTKPGGLVKPCCRYDGFLKQNLTTNTLSEIFYSGEMSDIRKKMMDGIPLTGCNKCYQEEENGKKSYRQIASAGAFERDVVDVDKPEFQYIEFALSNMCNLKCRGCRSGLSTSWYEDDLALGRIDQSQPKVLETDINMLDIDFKKLRRVRFTGGEPLINIHHDWIIDQLSPDVQLKYSTNCTIFPREQILERWKNCRQLMLDVSIDGFGDVNEYFRTGASWDRIQKTFDQLYNFMKEHRHVKLRVWTVVNIATLFGLPKLQEWLLQYPDLRTGPFSSSLDRFSWSTDYLINPKELAIRNLPEDLKIMAKLMPINTIVPHHKKDTFGNIDNSYLLRMLNQEPNCEWTEVKNWINKLDTVRGDSIVKVVPELEGYF